MKGAYIKQYAKGHRSYMDPVPACFRRPSIREVLKEERKEQENDR